MPGKRGVIALRDGPSNSGNGNGNSNGNGNGNGNNKSSTPTATSTTSTDKKHDGTTTAFSSTSSLTSTSSVSSTKSSSNNSGSSSSTGSSLSTGARTGIAFGVLFGAISLVLLFYCCKRRARQAKERAASNTALPLSSEVQRDVPPVSVPPPESSLQDITPPSQLNANEVQPLYSDGVADSPFPAAAAADLIRRGPSYGNGASPLSSWRPYNTLSPLEAQSPVIIADTHLPNPYDPFTASSQATSLGLMSAASPSTTTAAYSATVSAAGSSASASTVPERRASMLHTELLLHQKQLEMEHNKEGLEPHVEASDPPPSYSS